MKIYVLVEVTYDYYRFQENVYASVNKKNVISFYKENKNNDYELINYGYKNKLQEKYDHSEKCHYWIQEFNYEEEKQS